MAADIDTQNFFLIGQEGLLIVFLHCRQRYVHRLLCRVSQPVKQAHLSAQRIFLFLRYLIQDLGITKHILMAVAAKAIQRTGFDKILHCTLVDFFTGETIRQITNGGKGSIFLSFGHNGFLHRLTNTFDRRQTITDSLSFYGKFAEASVNIRRQDLYAHLAAGQNIFGNLRRVIYYRSHQRCHKFHRIIVFQPGRLVRYYRIGCRMGFIKGIFCKIRHIIVDLIGYLLGNTIADTARNPLFFITVNKILSLFCHNSSFFL